MFETDTDSHKEEEDIIVQADKLINQNVKLLFCSIKSTPASHHDWLLRFSP